MTTPTLQMGHTIYIVSNKDQKIIPAIVQEETLHRTMQGETMAYKIAVGPKTALKVFDLAKIDGEVFGSLEEVRQTLSQRLIDFVNKTCETAAERARQWYGDGEGTESYAGEPDTKINPSAFLNEPQPKSDPADTTASMLALHAPTNSGATGPKNTTRQKLRESFTVPEEIPQDGVATIMPDGSIKNIKINLNG
jgi:hypothetical protein